MTSFLDLVADKTALVQVHHDDGRAEAIGMSSP